MKSQGHINKPGLCGRSENLEWNGSWYAGTFANGLWISGHWYFGIFENSKWTNGWWYGGFWVGGTWKTGSIRLLEYKKINVNDLRYFQHKSLISPKCFYKPNRSLCLNESRYTK